MAVTSSSSIPSAEKVPTTKSTLWQEEMRAKDQPDGSSLSPAQSPSQSQPPAASTLREPGLESKDEESTMSSDRMDCGRKVRVESGYFSLEKTKQDLKAEEQQLPPPLSPPSPSTPSNSRQYAALADVPKAVRISHREAFQVERRRLERRTRARSPGREEVARLFGSERR
ncbi:myosin phosphatase Rho-interacting protein-like isoform X2 [Leptonychotes weddellii]|uniref:Myosin phosphatase Rho-interacting protein-like isoform X2 n=3 Tax=Monachinae TaxID=3410119 RepID=A0A7F8RU32_LEPWE|nr:myosin phosphatase Rho-interacting protein-like isoform X2 [Leptonychotes weddellii]